MEVDDDVEVVVAPNAVTGTAITAKLSAAPDWVKEEDKDDPPV